MSSCSRTSHAHPALLHPRLRFRVHFAFDAEEECTVQVYLFAEETQYGSVMSFATSGPVDCASGVGQRFASAPLALPAGQHENQAITLLSCRQCQTQMYCRRWLRPACRLA